jgi:rubrerythrin
MSTYEKLLQEQIRNEFTASHQYTAVAVWYDDQDLPQLASHFYKQSLEERNHAMMMVQYLLDKDIRPQIPGVGEVVNDFKTALEPLELALQQEADRDAGPDRPRRRRLRRRAVHAVVPQGAGRGGLRDDDPGQRRQAGR